MLLSFGCEDFMGYAAATVGSDMLDGVVLIDGSNRDFATASSNGSGKSSLVEMIAFALYGKTIRGLDAKHGKDSVVRHGCEKGARAWVDIGIGSGRSSLRVERFRAHAESGNSIKALLDGKDVVRGRVASITDDRIVTLLGQIDFDLFKRAVIIHSRMTESFSTLNDRYLRYISERLIALPDFTELQKTAKEKKDAVLAKTELIESRVVGLEDRARDTGKTLVDLKRQAAKYDEDVQEQRKQIADRHSVIRKDIENCKTAIVKISSDILNATIRAQKIGERLDSFKLSLKKEKDGLELSMSTYAKLSAMLHGVQRTVAKYKELGKNKLCPECGQRVSKVHIEAKCSEVQNEGKDLVEKEAMAKVKMEQNRSHVKQLESNVELLSINMAYEESKRKVLKQKRKATREQLIERKGQLKDLGEHGVRANPFTDLLRDAEAKLLKYYRRKNRLTVKLQKRKAVLPYYEFWQWGFGPVGLRSYALDSVTPMLNRMANEYLEILTDGTITVAMSTVKTTDDGYKDKFTIEIDNLHGSDNLAADSDGEIACVDLALNFACADILSSRVEGGVGLLVVDQAIDNLDAVRGAKAVRLLSMKTDPVWCKEHSIKPKHTVLAITHRPELKDMFESVIQVEKHKGICRVI